MIRLSSVLTVLAISAFSSPVAAMTYDLSFDSNSQLTSIVPTTIVSEAFFKPVTLFNGDILNVVFNNVPTSLSFPTINPATLVVTRLDALNGGGHLVETVAIGGVTFGPKDVPQYGSIFQTYIGGPLAYGPTWTLSLRLLSGEPTNGGSGLSINHVRMEVALVPEASTWAMLLIGLAGVGFLAYRRRNQMSALTAN